MTVLRVIIALAVFALVVLCLGATALLGFLGYLVWLAGFPKAALATWAISVCPLALLGIVLAFLPDWMPKEGKEPEVSYDPRGNQQVRYPPHTEIPL